MAFTRDDKIKVVCKLTHVGRLYGKTGTILGALSDNPTKYVVAIENHMYALDESDIRSTSEYLYWSYSLQGYHENTYPEAVRESDWEDSLVIFGNPKYYGVEFRWNKKATTNPYIMIVWFSYHKEIILIENLPAVLKLVRDYSECGIYYPEESPTIGAAYQV